MLEIKVEYFTGCPHCEHALALAQEYKERHPGVNLKSVVVENDAQAEAIGFRGSPTILINGRDLFDTPVPDEPRMACRYYPEGLPDADEFEKMVAARM